MLDHFFVVRVAACGAVFCVEDNGCRDLFFLKERDKRSRPLEGAAHAKSKSVLVCLVG